MSTKGINKSNSKQHNSKTPDKNDWQRQLNNNANSTGSTDNPFNDGCIDSGSAIGLLAEHSKNEDQFREFKPKVLFFICCIIAIQLLIMNLIAAIVVISSVVGDSGLWFIHKCDTELASVLFDFLKYYISATIVELLTMFFFIIKSIYNQSILKLADIFSGHTKKKK